MRSSNVNIQLVVGILCFADFERLTLEDLTELKYMLCDVLDSLFVFLNRGWPVSAVDTLIFLFVVDIDDLTILTSAFVI